MSDNTRIQHVFPGHPVAIALEVMASFPNFAAANRTSTHGWPEALSCMSVNGAGGAVYQALDVLRELSEGGRSPEDAFSKASTLWQESRSSGDFVENLEAGNLQALELRPRFLEAAAIWGSA